MKVLLINGSPKRERSNTLRLSRAFLKGLAPEAVRERTVADLEIGPCIGCFSCWNRTPGKCCIPDDMPGVIGDMLWADMILWSFPLYYFSVPGGLKNLMDRQLPTVLPFMESEAKSGGHSARYDLGEKRHVVISTCGFYTAQDNYGGVTSIFDHLCGKDNYTAIFCGQGELFRVKELDQRTGEYLSWVEEAGREYAAGGIGTETRKKLEELLYPRDVFEAMADASWGVEKTGEKSDESLVFTRQMAALYRKTAWPGHDLVLEMAYTEAGKCYQILMTSEGSQVLTENFLPYTTRIETPYAVWKAIAAGDISGEEALARGEYRVKGDFGLMLQWDRYFGMGKKESELPDRNAANMSALLIPWVVFWITAAIDAIFGARISLVVCTLVPLVFFRSRRTLYDVISTAVITLMSLLLMMGMSSRILLPGSYLAFGLMWTISCFLPIPLTAHYSMNDYNGEEVLKNPLFMKTNRILTACWGVLYLLTPAWTFYLMGTAVGGWIGAINSVLPAIMGVFTAWFQKWYPAKVARGG